MYKILLLLMYLFSLSGFSQTIHGDHENSGLQSQNEFLKSLNVFNYYERLLIHGLTSRFSKCGVSETINNIQDVSSMLVKLNAEDAFISSQQPPSLCPQTDCKKQTKLKCLLSKKNKKLIKNVLNEVRFKPVIVSKYKLTEKKASDIFYVLNTHSLK